MFCFVDLNSISVASKGNGAALLSKNKKRKRTQKQIMEDEAIDEMNRQLSQDAEREVAILRE